MLNFLRTEAGRHVYEFECRGCDVTGEVGIPVQGTKLVIHECGEIFVHRPTDGKSLFARPRLEALEPESEAEMERRLR